MLLRLTAPITPANSTTVYRMEKVIFTQTDTPTKATLWTVHYANGDVYEGELKDGSLHGQGKMTYADGTVKEGRWENNSFVG